MLVPPALHRAAAYVWTCVPPFLFPFLGDVYPFTPNLRLTSDIDDSDLLEDPRYVHWHLIHSLLPPFCSAIWVADRFQLLIWQRLKGVGRGGGNGVGIYASGCGAFLWVAERSRIIRLNAIPVSMLSDTTCNIIFMPCGSSRIFSFPFFSFFWVNEMKSKSYCKATLSYCWPSLSSEVEEGEAKLAEFSRFYCSLHNL